MYTALSLRCSLRLPATRDERRSEMDTKITRAGREKCWAARDKYFACVAGKGTEACSKERELFEGSCVASWVKYFDELREQEVAKARLLQEAKR